MAKLSRRVIAETLADAWVDKSVNRKDLVKQTSALLIEEGRKHEVDLVVADMKDVLLTKYGIVVADVYSKNELTDSNRTNIAALLKKKLEAKKVVINEHIDDSIIGGALVSTSELTVDLTLNSKLNRLRNLA